MRNIILSLCLGVVLSTIFSACSSDVSAAPSVEQPVSAGEESSCDCADHKCELVEGEEVTVPGTFCPKLDKNGKRSHSRGHFTGKDGREYAICFPMVSVCTDTSDGAGRRRN